MSLHKLPVGAAVIALLMALGFAASPEAASASGEAAAKRVTCRGPASLSGFFKLTERRKIVGKRTSCREARKVVKRFPKSCSKAYAAQGRCKVRSRGRWRCQSRLAGPLAKGSPSRETCKLRRSKLRFTVAYFPPTEPRTTIGPERSARRGPWDDGNRCVDTSQSDRVIPPPAPGAGSWEIHLMRGAPRSTGVDLQQTLIAQQVSALFNGGLGSWPRNHPDRIPIIITRGAFNAAWSLGLAAPTCEDLSIDGLIVNGAQSRAEIANTGVHELFHAHSIFGISHGQDSERWWEEASATWSVGRAGLREDTMYDRDLQHPAPPDYDPNPSGNAVPTYWYAMSRFVQFLDAGGYIPDPDWPLQRDVIHGYSDPGATAALAAAIQGVNPTATLGSELAAFWGDRLRRNPLHGPQLRPTARNSGQLRARPRTSTTTVSEVKPLDTELVDFTLVEDVKRVEFEFDLPEENSFFWGLVAPNEARQFHDGDSVSFCVGGGDEDDLRWPGHFPVTFTNGALDGESISAHITIDAQTGNEQCTNPEAHPACRVLNRVGVGEIFGRPGQFRGWSPSPRGWNCIYFRKPEGQSFFTDAVRLYLSRHRRARQAREAVRTSLEDDDKRRINVGDIGYKWMGGSGDVIGAGAAAGRYSFIVLGPLGVGPTEARNQEEARSGSTPQRGERPPAAISATSEFIVLARRVARFFE